MPRLPKIAAIEGKTALHKTPPQITLITLIYTDQKKFNGAILNL
jgi:hypothetical protein